MGIFEKFKIGLKKSASNFTSGLKEIIIKKEIDDKTLDEIEEFLIQSDVGVAASEEIKSIIAEKKINPNKNKIDEINTILKNYIIDLMSPLERENFFESKSNLNAILDQLRKVDPQKIKTISLIMTIMGACLIYFTFRFYGDL